MAARQVVGLTCFDYAMSMPDKCVDVIRLKNTQARLLPEGTRA
ncbi:hypothetical protein EM6_2494 [Asticcacaulis excentricus]|uniref:Uncharacterized protein n=1 Tax=Asticcacaulis excentricus TaxID=78587 RepID=A0A3G9G9P1_9CAUL|nr:hypothetical protein EM6_2494 [Asticcacaulis excentricus]